MAIVLWGLGCGIGGVCSSYFGDRDLGLCVLSVVLVVDLSVFFLRKLGYVLVSVGCECIMVVSLKVS